MVIEQALAGLNQTVPSRLRIQRRDLDFRFIDELSQATIASAIPTLTLNNRNAVLRVVRGLELLERSLPGNFDPTSDNIAIIEERWIAGDWRDFPLGMFRLELGDTRTSRDGQPVIECEAYDLATILTESGPSATYLIAQGTNYGTAIETILTLNGLASDLAPVTATLPVDQRWAAYPETTWWQVIHDLADGINYRTPWPNMQGRFVWSPKDVDPSQASANVTITDEQEPRMIADTEYRKRQRAGTIANRSVVLIDDPFHPDFPYRTFSENADPTSPVSTASRPERLIEVRWDTMPVSSRCILDETTADLIAETVLRDEAAQYQTATLTTLPDPRRGAHEYYRLTVTEKDGTYIEQGTLWRVVSWHRELVPGGRHTHELERVRPIALTGGS